MKVLKKFFVNHKQIKESENNNILNTSFKNISLTSNQSLDENEENEENELKIEKIFTDINIIINNIQDLYDNKKMTSDIESQRKLYFKLIEEKENIINMYNEAIKNITDENRKLKEKTKKKFTNYLQEKEEYKNNKKEIKQQLIYTYNKSNEIKQTNKKFQENFQKIKENEKYIESKFNNFSPSDNKDINAIIDILNILKKCPN